MRIEYDVEQMAMRCMAGKGIDVAEARLLASSECPLESLLAWGGRIRDHWDGPLIQLCSIISARSGNCTEDCAFCAQSANHCTSAPTHTLLPATEIIDAAKTAAVHGATCFGIVSSGRRVSSTDLISISRAIEAIRRECGQNMAIGASLGCLEYEELCSLKNAGLGHYNHNLESSAAFYPQICSTHAWEERRRTILDARRAGLEVCSGGIFGMGESWDDRIDLALTLRELQVRNIPLNFLMPIQGTLMSNKPIIEPEEALRIISLFRFILPDATIRMCGGRMIALGGRQADMFNAGVSAMLTGNYLTAAGTDIDADKSLIVRSGLKVTNCGNRSRKRDQARSKGAG